MQKWPGRYDPDILEKAFSCFSVRPGTQGTARIVIKAVTLKELAIGHVLSCNVETKDGMLIVCAGSRVSQMTLEKLRNFDQLQGIREPLHVQSHEVQSKS